MRLDEYVDLATLNHYVENNLVSVRDHNDFPLRIFNYTSKAQGIPSFAWTETLLKCRGLIVDHNNTVIAAGLNKFWNYTESEYRNQPFTCYDKLDGSLGVVYQWEGIPYVATRGSFHSEMADWANEFLDSNPDYREYLTLPTCKTNFIYTPHVEIIYKKNRVVVEYDFEDLVLLGYNHFPLIDIFEDDGMYWQPVKKEWKYPGRKAEVFHFDSFEEMIQFIRPNREGFVIQFEDESMFKIKYEKYLDLHRAIFGLSLKKIYEHCVIGDADEFILELPNEFHDEAREMQRHVMNIWWECYNKAHDYYHGWVDHHMRSETKWFRKDLVEAMLEDSLPGWQKAAIFGLHDQDERVTNKTLWKQVGQQIKS